MGTNYYMHQRSKTCKCCQKTDENDITHIGKMSWGWVFSFRGYAENYSNPVIKTVADWEEALNNPDTFIKNEYDEEVLKSEFWDMVDNSYSKDNRNHASLYPDSNWIDPHGYSFSGREFS